MKINNVLCLVILFIFLFFVLAGCVPRDNEIIQSLTEFLISFPGNANIEVLRSKVGEWETDSSDDSYVCAMIEYLIGAERHVEQYRLKYGHDSQVFDKVTPINVSAWSTSSISGDDYDISQDGPIVISVLNKKTSTRFSSSGENNTTIVYEYDDINGNLLSEEITSTETRAHKTIYSYDRDGNLITEETYWDGAPGLDSSISYTYDDERNLISKIDVGNFGTHTYHYTYGPDGNIQTETIVYSEDNLQSNANSGQAEEEGDTETKSYIYDDLGRVISKTDTYTGIEGVLWSSSIAYSYVEDSDRIATEYHSYNGKCSYTEDTTYTYDIMGNVLTEACVDQDGNVRYSEHIYDYDAMGNILADTTGGYGGYSGSIGQIREGEWSRSYIPTDFRESTEQWTYDEHGNILSYTRIASDRISYHTYTYNENNNVISEELEDYHNGDLTQKESYTYEYTDLVFS